MRRTFGLLTVVCVLASAPATGQEPTPPAAPAPPDAVAAQPTPSAPLPEAAAVPEAPAVAVDQAVVLDPRAPARTEVTLDRADRVGVGIGVAGPLGAVGSVRLLHGLGADVKDGSTRVKAVCAVPLPHCAQGFLLQADAGSGGGRLSLGVGAWANVHEEDFRGTAGVALRLALARTWGHPIGTEPGLTYLGPELDLSVIRINLTLGVLFRVAGAAGAGTLFSWGLGFGL